MSGERELADRQHWYKVAFFLVWKATEGKVPVVITAEDIKQAGEFAAVTFQETNAGLELRVVDEAEAARLMAEEGARAVDHAVDPR